MQHSGNIKYSFLRVIIHLPPCQKHSDIIIIDMRKYLIIRGIQFKSSSVLVFAQVLQ